jgi:alpha-mannosidase
MDGQYLMVEDYLEVRPSMRETVADFNRQGKITLGPWYSSQPDVFLA